MHSGGKARAQLVAEGLGAGISMQEGIAKQSSLDLVLEVIENRTSADTIQETVEAICPEHVASVANWEGPHHASGGRECMTTLPGSFQ